MVETSLQEAEDMMLSLPYTQIRQQVYRLASALEVVRLANMVRATIGDSSTVLVDIDLKNTITREHHRHATSNESFHIKGVGELPSLYNGSHGAAGSQSRSEMVKADL